VHRLSAVVQLFHRFTNPFVIVLLVASAIAASLGQQCAQQDRHRPRHVLSSKHGENRDRPATVLTIPVLRQTMLEWMKRRAAARDQSLEGDAVSAEGSTGSGKSAPLHKYLDDRYADAVVLTFAEIEDLAGFALPDLARRSNEWWTAPDPDTTRSRFADSWTQAKRTARPNLAARTVAFLRAC
jgi:hypothetical protein